MPSKETAAQPVRQRHPSSRPKAQVARFLLPVCCVCGLIRDETDPLSHRTLWVTPGSYQKTHHILSIEIPFTHTYCPVCFRKAKTSMKQFFREQKGRAHDSGSSD